jgi:hypothetical protein
MKNEKEVMLKVYNEGLETRKGLTKDYDDKLSEWEESYDAKVKEKSQIKGEIKREYENELAELESSWQGLSLKDRLEQRKWKKLELKAKYKLEEKEREEAIKEDIKKLLMEKKEFERGFNEKKRNLRGDVSGKEIIQKRKEINDEIKEAEKHIRGLKKKISGKKNILESLDNRARKLEEEREKVKDQLMDKKKEVGGLSYVASLFKFAKKKELKKQKEEIKKKRKDKSREFKICHKLLLSADRALRNGYHDKAKNLYFKARKLYVRLEYWEKKEIYNELTVFYRRLNK